MRQPAIQECLMSVAFGAKMENSSSKVFGEFKVGCEDAYLKFCDVVRANKCLLQMAQIESEFGLTPSSRSRIRMAEPADQADPSI
jgi:Phage terminase, small subunit